MSTVTIPKKEYENLLTQADLYAMLVKKIPIKKWGIELYSPERMREFAQEDKLDTEITTRIKKILRRK
ncbi:MAG TPA: hypothetical protein VJJ24_02680 [Candidatus Paceibacterota bacterium]